MKKPSRWFYLIDSRHLRGHQVEAVLDMLRYDGAVVEGNPPRGYYLLTTEARNGPNIDRWLSFGIQIAFVGGSSDAVARWSDEHPVHPRYAEVPR